METINKTKITVDVKSFRELLSGAIVCADSSKHAMPTLNTVALSMIGNELVARSTDRYRLIEGKVLLDSDDFNGELPVTLIAISDVKRIIELSKGISAGYFIIERDDSGRLSVNVNANTGLTISPVDGIFPPFDRTNEILELPARKLEPVLAISFNPKFMADFGKISKRISVTFTGEKSPIHIKLDGELVIWRAVLMPVKSA